MTLVLAAIGIASMDSLNEASTGMADSIWPRAIQANLALDNARGSFGRLAQLFQFDSKLRSDGAERLVANIRGFNDALSKLAPMLVRPDGKALLATSLQKRDTYIQICSRVLELTRNGKAAEANALTFGAGYIALHAFAGSLRAQIDFQEKRFDTKNSDADALLMIVAMCFFP
jgi:methyl-accepting chemotaxis protein